MPPKKSTRAASAQPVEKAAAEKPVVNGVGTGRSRSKKPEDAATKQAPVKVATGRSRAKKAETPAPVVEEPEPAAAKRKKADESDVERAPKAKKAKGGPKGPVRRGGKKTVINEIRYTEPLRVFVFGEGSSGELGLGSSSKAIDVKRPRYNEALSDQNVVRMAVGGMHTVALTQDNRILTWGVNDNGALGRDTSNAEVKLVDIDEAAGSDSDSDTDSDPGLNVLECTPTEILAEHFPEDTEFVDVAAGDSCSFFLTTEGAVYGCGTFRKNEGVLGFTKDVETARTPIWISSLKKITQITCGDNHVLALDVDGHIWAWGSGQQNQLGRRVTERGLADALTPTRLGFIDKDFKRPSKQFVSIACGQYYAFGLAADGHVWSWGANSYGETGHPENAGEDSASISTPQVVHALEGCNVTSIAAGSHHTLALTKDNEVLVWGRCDGGQTGIAIEELKAINDKKIVMKAESTNTPKILVRPTTIPSLPKDIVFIATGSENSFAINAKGKAYSWGFSTNYQTGQGSIDDVETPTLIDNTAVRDTHLFWAGGGGQFSIMASKK